jgi:hypothetical protein
MSPETLDERILADAHSTVERLSAKNTELRAERDGAVAALTVERRQHTTAQRRRDALQADYEEIRQTRDVELSLIYRLRQFIESNMYDAPGQASRRAREIVAETPAQSVAHIKGAGVREAATVVMWGDSRVMYASTEVINRLRKFADYLLGREGDDEAVTVCTECVQPYESHRPACPYCLAQLAGLQAQNVRLRHFLSLIGGAGESVCHSWSVDALALLAEKPDQSVAHIEAAAVRRVADTLIVHREFESLDHQGLTGAADLVELGDL